MCERYARECGRLLEEYNWDQKVADEDIFAALVVMRVFVELKSEFGRLPILVLD